MEVFRAESATVADVLNWYRLNNPRKSKSKKGLLERERLHALFAEKFGTMPCVDGRPHMLYTFIIEGAGENNWTRKRWNATLQRPFNFAARLGLKMSDFDVIELNEAFASQGIAVLRQLGVAEDAEHVNPNGGAIALGHPLGMSGARIALSAAMELQERQGKKALCTMCIGVGQGIALAMERV